MIKAILADHNLAGHLKAMFNRVWLSPDWIDFWNEMQITAETYASLQFAETMTDEELWTICQNRQIVLLTANRNEDGDDSLNAVISRCNTDQSLPVITISDGTRFWLDRQYADAVAVAVIDRLYEIERLRGTGRLYVP